MTKPRKKKQTDTGFDPAALKLLYLALRNMQTRWTTARQWVAALPHFAVLFGDRFVPET